MTHDRNYLRMLSDSELTHYAKEQGTGYDDLEIVLLERLSALLDVEDQLEQLQILYDRLVAENNAMRDDAAE